jgi:uncharacterized protein (DUF1330 family)
MKSIVGNASILAAGLALGAIAVEELHAQTKQPVYTIAEIQIKESDRDAYTKEFSPKAQAALKSIAGSQFVAAGTPMKIEGDLPPSGTRITIRRYNSIEDAKAAYSSPEYKEARKIGDKYATFRVIAIEGVPQ